MALTLPRPAFLEKLTPREQKLAMALMGVAAVMLLLALPVGLETMIASRRSDNNDMRDAIAKIQDARTQIRDRQTKRDAVAARYANKAPPLAGFIEQQARAQKLEVTDSVDRPDLPIGKQFTQKETVVHLKKANMLAIAKLLEGFERSGNPIIVSRLNIRKRSAEPDSWDVELGISAFERQEQKAPAPKASAAGTEKKP
jgi:general secretion pathway protein M